MKTKIQQPKPGWQNQRDAAAGQDVSVSAFVKWGIQPVGKIGREVYYLPRDISNYLSARENADLRREVDRYREAEQENTTGTDREKMLLTREQRIGQELKNAQARRELAPVGVIDWTLSKVAGQISAILESIPMRVKQLLPKMTAAEIGLIEREVIKAQNAAASVTVDFDEYDRERAPAGTRESGSVGATAA